MKHASPQWTCPRSTGELTGCSGFRRWSQARLRPLVAVVWLLSDTASCAVRAGEVLVQFIWFRTAKLQTKRSCESIHSDCFLSNSQEVFDINCLSNTNFVSLNTDSHEPSWRKTAVLQNVTRGQHWPMKSHTHTHPALYCPPSVCPCIVCLFWHLDQLIWVQWGRVRFRVSSSVCLAWLLMPMMEGSTSTKVLHLSCENHESPLMEILNVCDEMLKVPVFRKSALDLFLKPSDLDLKRKKHTKWIFCQFAVKWWQRSNMIGQTWEFLIRV